MRYPTLQHLVEVSRDGIELTSSVFDRPGADDSTYNPDRVAESIADWMYEHAQPWIVEAGLDNPIYRGSYKRARTMSHTTITIRQDRRPALLNTDWRDAFNDCIAANGRVANRSNSAFASTNVAFIKQHFGNISVFIPQGKFHYTWFPDVKDANFWYPGEQSDYNNFAREYDGDTLAADYVRQCLKPKGDDNSLVEAINSGCEVMISPESRKALLIHPTVYDSAVEIYKRKYNV